MSTTNSAGSHSHTLKGPSTYAAGSHRHDYTDLVGAGVPGPAGPTGPTGPTGPAGPPGVEDPATSARIDALEARVASLEGMPPPPPPPPASRPFPAPVTTRTVAVPATIDATGATDVAGALQTFLASVPDGSVITFPAGGIYRLDRGISLQNRHNLVFEGNGATLRLAGSGASMWSTGFVVYGTPASVSDIAVLDFGIEGSNPRTGAALYDPAGEAQHGVGVYGGARIEVAGCTIRRTWGDAIVAGRDVTVERNRLDRIGCGVFDIEPDLDAQGADGIAFVDNAVGTWGLTPRGTSWFVSAANQSAAPNALVRNVAVARNTITGGPPAGTANNLDSPGLRVWIGRPARMAGILVEDNVSSYPGKGPALIFSRIDGLTVRRNVQPLTSGVLASITDCTGVVAT